MEQSDLLKFALVALEGLRIPYAIVGSFASGVWGESRFTQDIDILIQLSDDRVSLLCNAFPASDFYVSETAAHDAVTRHGQFKVIHPTSGNKIDFMIAKEGDWTANQLARRKRVQLFPGEQAAVAAPEDVILGKLIYYYEGGSDKHLRDIASILKISSDLIDRDYIANVASVLGVTQIWRSVLSKLESLSQ